MNTFKLAAALTAAALASGVIAAPVAEAHFAVIGDFGQAGQPELDVANLVKSWNPEFITTTGDNNYLLGEAATIDLNIGQYYHDYIFPYVGTYGAGSPSGNRFWPVLGNHDWASGQPVGCQPYLDYFTLPGNERYYEFTRGPVHFYMIDSDPNEPDGNTLGSTQSNWLRARLRAAGDPWHFVFVHHPPFSSGATHGSNFNLQWTYREWGASAVLGGHEHNYERIHRNGLPHFVNGLGGRSLYPFAGPVSGSQARYNADYGAQRVDADSDSVTLQFFNRAGTLADRHTLTPWRLGGGSEPNLQPLATNGARRLIAQRVGDWLYVAAESASLTADCVVYIARDPFSGPLTAAAASKSGQVAAWDFALTQSFGQVPSVWVDSSGSPTSPAQLFEPSTSFGELCEGAFNLRDPFGTVPPVVYLAATAYDPGPGGALQAAQQVPAAASPDSTVQAAEFFAYTLPPEVTQPVNPYTIDGLLDPGTLHVGTTGGLSLIVGQQGEWLYVAANAPPASPSQNDVLIFVSRVPGAPQLAPWSKLAGVAGWDFFLGREGASTLNNWYDDEEDQYLRISRFHNGCEDGQFLEGAFNMRQAWGNIPASVGIAAGEFGTEPGDTLDNSRQVPAPASSDGIIQPEEFFVLNLNPIPVELSVFGQF